MSRRRGTRDGTPAPTGSGHRAPGEPSSPGAPPASPSPGPEDPAPTPPAPPPPQARTELLRRAWATVAAFAVIALLLPWGGPALGALDAARDLLAPGLARLIALLTMALAATAAASAARPAPGLAAAAGVVGALALWGLLGVSQGGVTTLLDPWGRGVLPAPLLSIAMGAALVALADAPASLPARVLAAAAALLLAGLLLAPVWPDGALAIPLLALTDARALPVSAALVALLLVGTLALVPLVLRRTPPPALLRTLGALALLHPPLWLAVTGAPLAAVALSSAAALAVAASTHALLTAPPPGWLPRALTTAEALAVAVPLALYALLKTHGMRAADGDENIYFYMAHLVANGEVPYRDFFFAHPPVHVLVPALLFKVFGFSVPLAKAIAPIAAAGAGLFAWATARARLGRLAAALTLPAFLFASELLKASTNLTGVNLTLLFISAGTYYALTGRLARGGAAFGLAASTGFYAVAGAAVLGVLLIATGWRPALRFLVGFAAVFGAINLFFWALGGDSYVDGVYRYHLLKEAKDPDQLPLSGAPGGPLYAIAHNFAVFLKGKEMAESTYYHGALYWTAALAPLPLLVRALLQPSPALPADAPRSRRLLHLLDPRTLGDGTPESAVRLLYLVALGYFLQLSLFKELYDFYFVLPFAALAPLAAWTLAASAGLVADGLARVRGARPGTALLGIAFLALTLAAGPIRQSANARAWPDERANAGARVDFAWSEPPHLAALSGVVHLLFWRDHRTKGALQPGTAHYLWSKKRWFSTAQDMADHIRATTPADATILGASTIAPLVALLADRAIAANEVDTNSKRFKAGLSTIDELFTRACDTKLAILISAPRSLFAPQTLSRIPLVRRHFTVDRVVDDPRLLHGRPQRMLLLRRTGDLSAAPPVCGPAAP